MSLFSLIRQHLTTSLSLGRLSLCANNGFLNSEKTSKIFFSSRNSHSETYIQGQSPEARIREYFYYMDHQGMLFLDDSKIKNFTSAFKDKQFLKFFITRIKKNDTGIDQVIVLLIFLNCSGSLSQIVLKFVCQGVFIFPVLTFTIQLYKTSQLSNCCIWCFRSLLSGISLRLSLRSRT